MSGAPVRRSRSAPAPRIYNLHPLLAGPIDRWPEHFSRIAAMGFDHLYVNAFFAPGQSGSLYSVADPFELHPLVRGDLSGSASELIAGVAAAARAHGLGVMTDLILPHAAPDGRLAAEHPDWLRRDASGVPMAPRVPDPMDPLHPRIMHDLVEIELDHDREPKLVFFESLARHFLELGIGGFRCSAAYKVAAGFWRPLLDRLRATHPRALFLGAALGCPFDRVLALEGAGFDLVFDSSCWWNLHDGWYLDQRAALDRVGSVVAFPEDHNSGRLGARLGVSEPETLARHYRARYLAALGLGNGVMMPMGFEHGCLRPLDPVTTRPQDWLDETQTPRIDLCGFLAEANRAKSDIGVLNRTGPIRRVTSPNGRVVGILRLDRGSPAVADEAALLIANPDPARPDGVAVHDIVTAAGGRFESFTDRTPAVPPLPFDVEAGLTLGPLSVRLFTSSASVRLTARAPAARESKKRLAGLAPSRLAIEKVQPELDGGRFPIKRVVGDLLTVEADIFSDGHETLAAALLVRAADETEWRRVPMALFDNDRWRGACALTRNTRYRYSVEAWRDVFATWRHEIGKKHDAGLAITLELAEGTDLVRRTAGQAPAELGAALDGLLTRLDASHDDDGARLALLLGEEALALMGAADLRANLTRYGTELEVIVDRTAAAFAAWYELFPRSQSDDPTRHGTFDDVIGKLPYVQAMGFDVLYFPPIHPIGATNRKGRNNSLRAGPDDPGSPYAIGAAEGGHDALHPELGDFKDFARLVDAAHEHGLEIAIDLAINCSPDHPWIKAHPEWFDWRPDGTLRFAENPPKKYEDICNVSFYREEAFPGLWLELRDVVLSWVGHGVKIFRVDNPHTKPFPFWEWLIREVQERHPETIFLSEAFTRPKVMARLAKIGFSQSYSYFTWRNTKAELREYLTELTRLEAREHMRPNFFVNTPDINPRFLQTSGRAGFQLRAVLAATLSTLWGVYSGFELCEATPIPGKEEYLNSEKYEIKAWGWDRPGHIRDDITLLNRVRRDNPALWQFTNLEFHEAWNDHVLVYSKMTKTGDNAVLVAVNLDPHQAQAAHFELPLWKFGLDDRATIGVEDLITGSRFEWSGKMQHLRLDPQHRPYALWRLVPPGLPS